MRAVRLTAAVIAALTVVAACTRPDDASGGAGGGFEACAADPAGCNAGPTEPGGTMTYALGKDVKAWNTLSSAGNTVEYQQALAGVLGVAHVFAPDLKHTINTDTLASMGLVSSAPMTVQYKIQPNAVWSDGTPISAEDFIWVWKVMNGRDCTGCTAASNDGYQDIAAVAGADNGKTVTATFSKPYPDWQGLFGTLYPAHLAAQQGDLAAGFSWMEKTVPTWSGGPYRIEKHEPNFALTLVRNERWFGKSKAPLDRIVYRIITNDAELAPALRNGEVSAVNPIVTPDILAQVREVPDVNSHLGKGLSWEHLDFNLKNPALADRAIRQAIFTAINRADIIAKTVGQYAPDTQPMGSHNFVPTMPGYVDHVSATGQGSGDLAKAREILAKAGYRSAGGKLVAPSGKAVPPLRIRHTVGNQLRRNTCELVANMVKELGVEVRVEPTDNLGATLTSGDFDIMIFAWMLSPLRIGAASSLWASSSASNYGRWSNPASDKLLAQANQIVGDDAKAFDLINQADKIMTEDAYVLPLFQRESFTAVASRYANIRPNPTLSGVGYNIAQWGLRAQ
ncbi:ABC transporter family substrate-binding protein [Pilimelia columellifera]|uniref:ABC transporter family substrate-binding protein n=1 Tax=Pilimelia columellifera subsp. columellifera TaxID=706583 RepID=A0ABN3NPD5_9ACTN